MFWNIITFFFTGSAHVLHSDYYDYTDTIERLFYPLNNTACMILDPYKLVLIDDKFIKAMSEDRKMYKCTCSDCGKDSEVPFEPKPDRPVYCKECLPKHRN